MKNQYDQSKLNERFDSEAQDWKSLYELAKKNPFKYNNKLYRQQYALEMLGNGPGLALDLGCGSGVFFQNIEALGYQVMGLDFSSKMVELASAEAQNLENSRVIRGDALQLPFADNTFDALIAVGLLEYFPSDEEFLEKIERIMKPGSRIVITLRNARCLERKLWKFYRKIGINKNKTNYYFREHDPRAFEALLASMKFKNIQRRFCHFYPLPWPLSRFIKPINAFLSHKMENMFSMRSNYYLGSTYIVSFDIPEE